MAIPKIIHYCWFGDEKIPKLLLHCIKSWKTQLPDYVFILWNEDNTEFDCNYVKKAYDEKKWAFVSDYIRLKVIYEYGGVYLDTDMLLLKSLDDFLEHSCFFVAEHKESIGVCVFGASKNNGFVKLCLNAYNDEKKHFIPMPKIVSDIFFEQYKVESDFSENIFFKELVIYKPDYFYALPYNKLFDIHNYKIYLTNNSYGVHLWFGSWHSYNALILLRRKEYYKAIKKIYNTIFIEKSINYTYFKKIIVAFKDSLVTPNAFK